MFHTIHLRKLIGSLAITLGVGFLTGFLTGNQSGIYQTLNQPPLAPPGWVFGVVWTVLYFLMGIALYFVRITPGEHKNAVTAFAAQLFLNFCWPLLFFGLQLYCFSAIWLFVLLIAVAITTVLFFQVKPVAGWLLIPYFIWCVFALYLNIGICVLN